MASAGICEVSKERLSRPALAEDPAVPPHRKTALQLGTGEVDAFSLAACNCASIDVGVGLAALQRYPRCQGVQIIGACVGISSNATAARAAMAGQFRCINTCQPNPPCSAIQRISVEDLRGRARERRGRTGKAGPFDGVKANQRADRHAKCDQHRSRVVPPRSTTRGTSSRRGSNFPATLHRSSWQPPKTMDAPHMQIFGQSTAKRNLDSSASETIELSRR